MSNTPAIRELIELLRERDQALREKAQTILELAGRCSFYQSEIQHLKERIALLEAPKSDPADLAPAGTPFHPACERAGCGLSEAS